MRRDRRRENLRRLRQSVTDIEVRIDELILRGFSPLKRYALGEALASELETLFGKSGLSPADSLNIPWLRAQTPPLAAGEKPHRVGAQVARAVHGVLPK